jgi:osmotically-inducible protein OsmY
MIILSALRSPVDRLLLRSLLLTGLAASGIANAQIVSNSDEQAAYCMEASFGYTRQLTGLLALLRDNHDKGQALLAATNLSQTDRTQLETGMSTLNDSIASNETKRKAWESRLKVFTDYLQKNGLFGNSTLIASMSGQASKDQQAVQTAYRTCLRGCTPNDASCKVSCNSTAENSDANKRVLRCAEIVAQFK